MNDQIVPAEPQAIQPITVLPAQHRPPENPVLLVHRHLRGRYVLAIALGLALAIPGALGGRFALPATYQSNGIVRVVPTLPKVLYQTEENQLLPMFDSFVSTQAAFLQSRRILDRAVESDRLRQAGWAAAPEGTAELSKRLSVQSRRGSELITVSVRHENPKLAQAAVNAVLESYASIEEELNGTNIGRETALQQIIKDLDNELARLRLQTNQLAEEHGTDDLDTLRDARMSAIVRLDSSIDELDLRIAPLTANQSSASATASADAYLHRLATVDSLLRGYLEQKERILLDLATLAGRATDSHPKKIDLHRRLDALETRIAARVDTLTASTGEPSSSNPPGDMLAQLTRARERLVSLRDNAVEDLKRLGRTRSSILAMRERADTVTRQRDEAKARLDQMQVERQNLKSGRISIAQMGDMPVAPASDRRNPLTVFGGLLGLFLGAGLVWGFGFLRSGYRYADELEQRHLATPVLGMIPELSDRPSEHDEQAALNVHHLRNSLQLQTPARDGRGRVISVTSAMAGDGKTHLALALGMSFAMSGERTLLVDADLIGRALSHQMGLGDSAGFSEAIRAESLNGEVHPSRENLWVLPAGISRNLRPEELSSGMMQRVLDRARDDFDTIIVDSGPITGSLEAALACSMADRSVLVVSRGQNPRIVKVALDRIRALGGRCAGIIFNRAEPRDFQRSTSMISTTHRLAHTARHTSTPLAHDLTRILTESSAHR